MVKFAKYNPESSENESYFQDSWNFVLATKEAEAPMVEADIKTEKGGGAV
jgi:hypothetical protein